MLLFFFFKQKTAYEMRISDWSSDVCSSDLALRDLRRDPAAGRADRGTAHRLGLAHSLRARRAARARRLSAPPRPRRKDRKSVVSGKSVSVRVDLGVRRIIKKKKQKQHIINETSDNTNTFSKDEINKT